MAWWVAAAMAGTAIYSGIKKKDRHNDRAEAEQARVDELVRRAEINAQLMRNKTARDIGKADVLFAKGNVEGGSVLQAKNDMLETSMDNINRMLDQAHHGKVMGEQRAAAERGAGRDALYGSLLSGAASAAANYKPEAKRYDDKAQDYMPDEGY